MLIQKAGVLSHFTQTRENLWLSSRHKIKVTFRGRTAPVVLFPAFSSTPCLTSQERRCRDPCSASMSSSSTGSLAPWLPSPPPTSKSLVSKRLGDLLTSAGCLLSVLKEIWEGAVATVLELIDNDIPASVTHYPYYKLLRPNWKINSLLAPVPVAASFDCQLLSRVSTYMKGAVTAWCFQDNLTIWN